MAKPYYHQLPKDPIDALSLMLDKGVKIEHDGTEYELNPSSVMILYQMYKLKTYRQRQGYQQAYRDRLFRNRIGNLLRVAAQDPEFGPGKGLRLGSNSRTLQFMSSLFDGMTVSGDDGATEERINIWIKLARPRATLTKETREQRDRRIRMAGYAALQERIRRPNDEKAGRSEDAE